LKMAASLQILDSLLLAMDSKSSVDDSKERSVFLQNFRLQHTHKSTAESFKRLLREQLGVPKPIVANLKGYASGIDDADKHWHEGILQILNETDVNVLIVDGDKFKHDSFTSIVPKWLDEDPEHRRLVLIRREWDCFKNEVCHHESTIASWQTQIKMKHAPLTILTINKDDFERAKNEILDIDIKPEHLEYTALGWITLTRFGSTLALAVGGGPVTMNEIRCSKIKWRHRLPPWRMLGVQRPKRRTRRARGSQKRFFKSAQTH